MPSPAEWADDQLIDDLGISQCDEAVYPEGPYTSAFATARWLIAMAAYYYEWGAEEAEREAEEA